jgi:Na+/H+-dicarboxylate symporter
MAPGAGWGGRGQTLRLLVALVLGVAAGLLARRMGWLAGAGYVGQLGQLWLNGLRMTLVPLVFCLMTAGVAEIARTAAGGRIARIAVTVFLALLVIGSVLGVFTMLGLMRLWPVAALRVAATGSAVVPPSLLGEFVALVPANPVAAAAEAAMAPLIVFATVFGAAMARTKDGLLLNVLQEISAALLVVVGWVLKLAPAGIFCLLVATVATVGAGGAKGLLQYAVLTSIVPAVGIVVAQVVGMLSGATPLRFARAAAATQTLAVTTQSSSACLPALIEAAGELALPPAMVAAIMPLAVTTFRFGNVFTAVAVGLVGANLFGVHPSAAQIVTAIALGILTNIGSVGVPGAAVLLAAWGPIFLALGAPLEALTLYIAIITVPDMLITVANVTADLAATSLIARWSAEP